jgi:hypothetical protein
VKWQEFIRSLPNRITGTHVELKREQPTRLSSWAHFPADEQLRLRQQAARELIGHVEVKADRKALENQPASFVDPQHVDELPIG